MQCSRMLTHRVADTQVIPIVPAMPTAGINIHHARIHPKTPTVY
jgi:hypothetical protein